MQKDEVAKEWQRRIDLGQKSKEKYSSFPDWRSYKDIYRGLWPEDDGEVPLNRVFSMLKSLLPRTYFRSPSVVVTPRRPEFMLHAKVVEAVDNWLIKEMSLKMQMKRAAMDAFFCGTGCLKLGFDSEYGYDEAQAIVKDSGTMSMFGRKTGDKIEYNQNMKSGMPWVKRIRPEEIIVPFGYDDPKAMPWICHCVIRPLVDVKEDQKYDKQKTSKLTGTYINSLVRKQNPNLPQDLLFKDEPYALLYEIRDAKAKKLIVISEDLVLLDIEDALQTEGLPWEFIRFNEDPDYFWGVPDVKILLPQQRELVDIKKQASKLRRYNILKFLYLSGAIAKEDIETLLSTNIDDIGAGIPILGEAIGSSVLPLQPHNLTRDLNDDQQRVLNDMRESIGLGQNQEGAYMPLSGKTATEAMIVNQGSEIRVDERRDIMADTLTNILEKVNQFIFKYWTTERVVEITGYEGLKGWIKYTGDQLSGEYFLDIDPEMGLPVSRALRHDKAIEIYNLFKGDPQVDQLMLKQKVLQQFDWLDPSASLLINPGQGTGNLTPPESMSLPQASQPLGGSSQKNPMAFGQALQSLRQRGSMQGPLMKGGGRLS